MPHAIRERFSRLRTEQIHPASRNLDRAPPRTLLRLMAREDLKVIRAVYAQASAIERGAALFARALGRGGRVFYLGAGTSGRLAVLEAAECPPTFGTKPHQIQAIVAGGRGAVFRSREGAEDRGADAVAALRSRKLDSRDLVIGVSASSVTPFVRDGLLYSRRRGAASLLVTCGRHLPQRASLTIAMRVGPEILAGSTRLKAGTATKLALNALTLLAMIRLQKVYGPFMVDLRPGSEKLRDRARRIVAALGRVTTERALSLLEATRGDVKTAIVCARFELSPSRARLKLREAAGSLRRVLEG